MESIENMEEVISSLLRADHAAQEQLHEHQQRRQQMADQIAAAREEVQRRCAEEAQRRVDAVRAAQQQAYDDDLRRMDASTGSALAELRRNFEGHRAEWVDTLVERCLH